MNILNRTVNLINHYVDYVAQARTVAELSQLSDRQLDDIGLNRAQLNTQLKTAWINKSELPKTEKIAPAAAPVVTGAKQPVREIETGLAKQLVSMYSAWNRPGYVV